MKNTNRDDYVFSITIFIRVKNGLDYTLKVVESKNNAFYNYFKIDVFLKFKMYNLYLLQFYRSVSLFKKNEYDPVF